jgi:hypothetical protein
VSRARSLSHHTAGRLRDGRVLLLAFAVAGALVGFMPASGDAHAFGVAYCANWIPSGSSCEGPQHTLTGNLVIDGTGSNSYVCDSATDSSGNSVGGWSCGFGYAESCYAGNEMLHPWLGNASPYWLYEYGVEYFAQGCP